MIFINDYIIKPFYNYFINPISNFIVLPINLLKPKKLVIINNTNEVKQYTIPIQHEKLQQIEKLQQHEKTPHIIRFNLNEEVENQLINKFKDSEYYRTSVVINSNIEDNKFNYYYHFKNGMYSSGILLKQSFYYFINGIIPKIYKDKCKVKIE